MKREVVSAWLECLDSKASSERGDWVIAPCPLSPWRHEKGTDSNPSFGVRLEQGDALTHCFSCGYSGRQSDLLLELKTLVPPDWKPLYDFKTALKLVDQAEDDLDFDFSSLEPPIPTLPESWPDWMCEAYPPAIDCTEALAYLADRKVPTAVIEALDLRFDPLEGRLLFPIRDFKKRLRGLHGRTTRQSKLKYLAYTYQGKAQADIWLGEHYVDLDRPVVIVESVFDLCRVAQVYRNVVAPLKATPSKTQIRRMAGASEAVLLFDRDAAGDQAVARIKQEMPDTLVRKAQVPEPYNDPGEVPVDQIAGALNKYVSLDETVLPDL
mgnify:CR=1 FL=1